MYFECNLPTAVPMWMDPRAAIPFINTMAAIRQRMEVLEAAKDLCVAALLPVESFAETAADVFKRMQAENGDFDALTPEELRDAVLFESNLYGKTKPLPQPRMEWPNAETVVDCRFVSTHEWEAIRHLGIGGSDAAVIMGSSHYRTQTELYHDKVGNPNLKREDSNSSVFVRGHFLEDVVVNTFCALTGAKRIPEYRMFRSKEFPCVTANIDAIVELNNELFVFEAKTTKEQNFAAWVNNKVPPQYIPQMRQYPAVLNDERIKGTFIGAILTHDYEAGDLYMGSSYDLSEFKRRFMPRDAEAEHDQLEAEADWWETYVENNSVPQYTGDMEKEIQVLNGLASGLASTAGKTTVTRTLPDDLAGKVSEWLELSEQSSLLDKQKKALDEKRKSASLPLIEALGPDMDTGLITINDETYEVKNSPRKGTEIKRDVLDLLIDTLYGTNPDLAEKFRDCIVDIPCKTRAFSIKKSKMKPA